MGRMKPTKWRLEEFDKWEVAKVRNCKRLPLESDYRESPRRVTGDEEMQESNQVQIRQGRQNRPPSSMHSCMETGLGGS
jgi:hypothetical protein